MSDRELLELAAKAAGYELLDVGDYQIYDKEWRDWNPLTNDGDALRLAIKFGMKIDLEDGRSIATVRGCGYQQPQDQDACAATRRAIVKCAAGWAM